MDTPTSVPTTSGPVVVGANWYRFRPGEHIHHDRVESVSFIWAVQGTGVITSAGRTFTLGTNAVLRLPWRHDVDYRADKQSPFHVGTIHVVPQHDFRVPVEPRVAVHDGDPLLDVAWRHAPDASEHPVLMPSHSTTGRSVIALASYCVERFLAGRTEEAPLRAMGAVITDESSGWVTAESVAVGRPVVLDLMIGHVSAHLERHMSVREIADVGGCSTTTAERMFARHTGLSVLSWARRRRMEEAALLLRTSGLRVGEVARRLGYSDPLYFSRVFTSVHSVPPSRYAAGQVRP